MAQVQMSKHFQRIIKNISKEIFEKFFCLVKILIPSSVCCYDSHGRIYKENFMNFCGIIKTFLID